jgi:hypothetical protein
MFITRIASALRYHYVLRNDVARDEIIKPEAQVLPAFEIEAFFQKRDFENVIENKSLPRKASIISIMMATIIINTPRILV